MIAGTPSRPAYRSFQTASILAVSSAGVAGLSSSDPESRVAVIRASPFDLYFCQTRVSDGACALQSPQPCAKKNISTGLPRSDASDGAGAPMTFAVSSAGAGFP